MSDRELDALIAEKVMGLQLASKSLPHDPYYYWDDLKGPKVAMVRSVPAYSVNRNASALVLERIGELGLSLPFAERALFAVGALHLSRSREAWWLLLNITPRQICETALEVLPDPPVFILNQK